MYDPSQAELDFLLALYQQTEGDTESQVSMYEVGSSLGLDKSASGSLSQDLMIEELIELRSLSGTISIMEKGLGCLQRSGLIQADASAAKLSNGEFIDQDDRVNIATLITEIQSAIAESSLAYPHLEELIIDIKTLEIQLLSGRPATAVVRAVLSSLAARLGTGKIAVGDRIISFLGK